MANVALTKPRSVTGNIIVAADIGVDSSDDFLIKVVTGGFRYKNPDGETTGDGDNAPAFEPSNWGYLTFRLRGFMIAGSIAPFKLASLVDTTLNPLAASMKFHLGTNNVLTIPTALINWFDIEYARTGNAVGLAMIGKATDSAPTWGST